MNPAGQKHDKLSCCSGNSRFQYIRWIPEPLEEAKAKFLALDGWGSSPGLSLPTDSSC